MIKEATNNKTELNMPDECEGLELIPVAKVEVVDIENEDLAQKSQSGNILSKIKLWNGTKNKYQKIYCS